jgi:hypothetical protein
MAKLPQGDTILPKLLPDASLGLGRCLVNKWNLGSLRINASVPPCVTPVAHRHRLCSSPRCARPRTDQRRGFQWQIRIDLNASKNRSDEQASNATLIGDLWRSVEVLTVDIEREEMRAHLGSNGLATFALRVCFILSF